MATERPPPGADARPVKRARCDGGAARPSWAPPVTIDLPSVYRDFTAEAVAAARANDVAKESAALCTAKGKSSTALFPHQKVALQLLLAALVPPKGLSPDDEAAWLATRAARPPLLVMPPGYGKTLVARGLCLAAVDDARRPIVYVTLPQLLAQTALELARRGGDAEPLGPALGLASARRLGRAPQGGSGEDNAEAPLEVRCTKSAAEFARELLKEKGPDGAPDDAAPSQTRRQVLIVSARCFARALAQSASKCEAPPETAPPETAPPETAPSDDAPAAGILPSLSPAMHKAFSRVGLFIVDEAHQCREAMVRALATAPGVPAVAMTATPPFGTTPQQTAHRRRAGSRSPALDVLHLNRNAELEAWSQIRRELRRLAIVRWPCEDHLLSYWEGRAWYHKHTVWPSRCPSALEMPCCTAAARGLVCLAIQALLLSRFPRTMPLGKRVVGGVLYTLRARLTRDDAHAVENLVKPLVWHLRAFNDEDEDVGVDGAETTRAARALLCGLRDLAGWSFWARLALALADNLPLPLAPSPVESAALAFVADHSLYHEIGRPDLSELIRGGLAEGCSRLLLRVSTLQVVAVMVERLRETLPPGSVRVVALDGRRRPPQRVAVFGAVGAGRTVFARLHESPAACGGALWRLVTGCPALTARILAYAEPHIVFVGAQSTVDCGLNLQTAVDGILCQELPQKRAKAEQLCGRMLRVLPRRSAAPPAWLVHELTAGTLDELHARLMMESPETAQF